MRFNSIKFKATTLISLLGIVIIVIFGYFSFINTKESLEKRYDNECNLVLKHTVFSLRSHFNGANNILELLADSKEIKQLGTSYGDERLVSLLEDLQKAMPDSRFLRLATENGKVYSGPRIKLPPSYDPRQQKWYILANKAEGRIVWTEAYLDYLTQKIIITGAKAVITPKGKVGGVIAVDFDVSKISQLISNSRIGTKGYVMLLSSNGTVIANKDDYLIGEHLFHGTDRITVDRLGEMDYYIKGEPYHLKVDVLKRNGMVVVTAISKREINENLLKSHWPVLLTGIICLIMFGLCAYLLALKGIAPLEKLVLLMKEAEQGNYQIKAEMKNYHEIASLCNSFNSMIEGIRKSEEKVKHLAYNDSLTGLANREKLIQTLGDTISRINEVNTGVAVVYIDLDNFKIINDTMGHPVGDKVLKEIAGRLNKSVKLPKVVARIGGDEFIITINGLVSEFAVMSICNSLVTILQEPVLVDSKSFNLTASIGVSLFPLHGTTVEELLKKADMAMYRAKSNGKNCCQLFDESMQTEIISKANIESALRESLKDSEFFLYYQPQYSIGERKICGFEALLRWDSPSIGRVPPMEFVKVAEETGLIVQLEKWVLNNACIFAKKVNSTFLRKIKISVNISAVHIMQSDFVENVINTIDNLKVNPEFIELEITETVMMDSFDSNKKKLEQLKAIGIDIHLDDFGSGYSSLSYLQNLPIDYVKIDKSFIDNMLNSEKEGRITATIVELAHNIGLKVVAEGVEKEEQYQILADYHCDVIQGYYIGKPMTEEEVLRILKITA